MLWFQHHCSQQVVDHWTKAGEGVEREGEKKGRREPKKRERERRKGGGSQRRDREIRERRGKGGRERIRRCIVCHILADTGETNHVPLSLRRSLSVVLGYGRDHVELSQDGEAAGPTITQLKNTLQIDSPFLEIFALHIPARED